MKKIYSFIASFLLAVTAVNAQFLISEFQPNPPGADPANVSFEISGAPGANFNGWVLSIEGDGTGSQGIVDRATSVSGTLDANGILVLSVPDFENPSFTVILCENFTGTVGTTDIDTTDDGVADTLGDIVNVYDALGSPDSVADETFMYGADVGGQDFTYTGDEPQLVFRDGMTGDWYAINEPAGTDAFAIDATAVPFTEFSADPSITTFGAINPSNTSLSTPSRSLDNFKIYPNPVSNGNFRIDGTFGSSVQVTLYNTLGKRVLDTKYTQSGINVSNLSKGVYLAQITVNNTSISRKLIIE